MDELLRFVLDSASEGMVILDKDFRILEVNAATASMFGLPPEAIRGLAVLDHRWVFFREDGAPFSKADQAALKTLLGGGAQDPMELGIRKARSTEVQWVRVRSRPRYLADGAGVEFLLVTFENITESRAARARLSRKIATLNSVNDYALHLDGASRKGLFDLISESARIVFDARAGSVASYCPDTRELTVEAISWSESLESGVMRVIGRGIKRLAAPVSEDEYRIMMDLKIGAATTLSEFSFGKIPMGISDAIEKTLGIGWFRGVVLVSEGKLFGALGLAGARGQDAPEAEELQVFAEITANAIRKKDAEARIAGLLEEKEALLHEVHHRIKNNMNTMISLLSLQSYACSDGDDASAALRDAMGRLQSMSTLYDKLYRGQDLRSLSLSEYLPSLVSEIVATFPGGREVELDVKAEDVLMGTRQLPLVGIIVNELVTNAMKYAFGEGRPGRLSVAAQEVKGKVRVAVSDNGPGMPPGFELDASPGFGLGLVRILAKQLDASLGVQNRGGAHFTLEFELD